MPAGVAEAERRAGGVGALAGSGDEIMARVIAGERIVIEHSAMRQNVHNSLKSVSRG